MSIEPLVTIQPRIEIMGKIGVWVASPAGRGIVSITDNGDGTITILFTDATTQDLTLPVGPSGNGIASIAFKETVGLIDTYTITFDDATTFDFDITNGDDGADGYTPIKDVDYFDGTDGNDGASITSAAFVSNDLVFTKDDATTVTLVNAKITLKGTDGIDGIDGASITSAAFVSNDLVFTKDDTTTVTLANAKITLKGTDGIDGIDGADGPNNITTSTTTNLTGFLKGNGSVVSVDSNSYELAKSDDDNYVTDAEKSALHSQNTDTSLDFGGLNQITASDIKSHTLAANIHRAIDDTSVLNTDLWSADKINTMLGGKEAADATILKESEIVNTLVSTSTTAPLSAAQGKILNDAKFPFAGGTLTGNLLFTDNTLDIGASGATRPRTLFLGTSLITPAATISGMTAGSVLFAGTGGLLSQNNANLFWDNANVRLGIGTAAPQRRLHLSTAASGENVLFETTEATSGRIGFDLKTGYTANAGDYFRFIFRGDFADVTLTVRDESAATSNEFLKFSYLTKVLALGLAADTVILYGNVGVGVTSPTAKLHLKAGTATASTAPLKLTSGVLNTVAEAGAIEFLTDDFFATITTGAVRKKIVLTTTAAAPSYTVTNGSTDRGYDANSTTLDEIADVLATLIADLKNTNIIQ